MAHNKRHLSVQSGPATTCHRSELNNRCTAAFGAKRTRVSVKGIQNIPRILNFCQVTLRFADDSIELTLGCYLRPHMRLRIYLAAAAVTAIPLVAWVIVSHQHSSADAVPPRVAAFPILEKLRWGMTISQVHQLYPQIDVSYMQVRAPHGYAMYWVNRYPWRDCLAKTTVIFGPRGLMQIWLDDNQSSQKSCKVMVLDQIQQNFGEGVDQNRLAPTARIPDCKSLTPQDRTWPAHMGGIWRCWKKDGTLVRVFDGEPQPVVLSKAGSEETSFARPSIDALWAY
jgi:hypothetical protein